METKYNEATLNRPEGDRIIDAPFVFIDLKKFSEQLREEEWRKNDRKSITVYKTDGFTMVLCYLRNGAILMDNLVSGLISIQVMEGTIDFTVETGTIQITKQEVVTIHSGIMHTIRALENTLLLMSSKTEKDSAESFGNY